VHAHPQLADAARGKVALAQVLAHHGAAFRSANRLVPVQLRAMRAIDHPPAAQPRQPESLEAFWLRVAHLDIHQCPHCNAGRMVVIGPITAQPARAPPRPRPP
jgi:hypothetical protein